MHTQDRYRIMLLSSGLENSTRSSTSSNWSTPARESYLRKPSRACAYSGTCALGIVPGRIAVVHRRAEARKGCGWQGCESACVLSARTEFALGEIESGLEAVLLCAAHHFIGSKFRLRAWIVAREKLRQNDQSSLFVQKPENWYAVHMHCVAIRSVQYLRTGC